MIPRCLPLLRRTQIFWFNLKAPGALLQLLLYLSYPNLTIHNSRGRGLLRFLRAY